MPALKLAAAALVAALAPGAAAAQVESDPVVIDRIAAVVNDAIVLQREVDARVALLTAAELAPGAADTDLPTIARDALIEEALIAQAARAVGLTIADDEVTAAIQSIMAANAIDQAGLEVALAEQGFTMASYRESIRRELVRYRMVSYVVQPAVQITDRHVREAYDHLKGIQGDQLGAYEDVAEAIRSQLYQEATISGTQQWLDQLRREAHIELR